MSDTSGYVENHSDTAASLEWGRAHVAESKAPPVSFLFGGADSSALEWVRRELPQRLAVDYPCDSPAERRVRTIVFSCRSSGLEITTELTSYPGFPVVEFQSVLRNVSGENSPVIERLAPRGGDLLRGVETATVRGNNGGAFKTDEYRPFCDKLSSGRGKSGVEYSSTNGYPTSCCLPMFNVSDSGAPSGAERGVIAALSWQGSWRAGFSLSGGELSFCGGQADTRFSLLPGESFRTPITVFLWYKGSFEYGQNVWRRWYLRHNVLRRQGLRMTTNVLYCISRDDNGMLNTAEENRESLALVKKCGLAPYIDYINQDAGWYDCGSRKDWGYTGNWYPDRKRYPNGLREISDLAHEQGMKYSVWFEPERTHSDTSLASLLCGDYMLLCVDNGGGVPRAMKSDEIPRGAQCMTNYAMPEVVDKVIELLDGIIKSEGIDQYRQDGNFAELASFWTAYDNTRADELGIPRRGVAEEKYTAGYLRLWNELIDRNPGLVIDSCSGGGRRNDLETVRMSFIHTRSDYYWDDSNVQNQTYGMSMWYILMGAALIHIDDEYDNRSHFVTSIAILPDEERAELLKTKLDEWRDRIGYFFGDYYPLTPYNPGEDGALAMQFDRPESGDGLVAVYLRSGGSADVRPMGLDADASYELRSADSPDDVTVTSGAELAEKGFSVASEEKYAFIYKYRRV